MNNKKGHLFVLLLATLGILLYACRKNDVPTNENKTDPSQVVSVEEAKKWYESLPEAEKKPSDEGYLGTPDWKHTFSAPNTAAGGVLKVPLENVSTPHGYKDILFHKQADGAIIAKVVQVGLYPEYRKKKSKEKPDQANNLRALVANDDFSGVLLQFDIKGTLIDGLNYENGALKNIISIDTKGRQIRTELNCDNPKGPEIAYCMALKTVTITAPSIPPPPSWPLQRVPVGPGGPLPIGGGGAGKNSVNEIKTDQITNKCLSDAIRQALNRGLKNKITTVFNNLFSGTDGIDITFKEDALAKPTNAFTQAVSRYDIEITLDNVSLPKAATELIVATILHEAVHAMYDAKGLNAGANKFSFTEYVQHNLMANKYVNEMASALREIFPTLPDYDAKALAWEGLQDGVSWKALDPTEANKLLLAGDEYDENHKKGNRCSK